jgi:DNA-directed RNA polymerase subunit RPC12/RpoP
MAEVYRPKQFSCPKCAKAFQLPIGFHGGAILCPHCHHKILVNIKAKSPLGSGASPALVHEENSEEARPRSETPRAGSRNWIFGGGGFLIGLAMGIVAGLLIAGRGASLEVTKAGTDSLDAGAPASDPTQNGKNSPEKPSAASEKKPALESQLPRDPKENQVEAKLNPLFDRAEKILVYVHEKQQVVGGFPGGVAGQDQDATNQACGLLETYGLVKFFGQRPLPEGTRIPIGKLNSVIQAQANSGYNITPQGQNLVAAQGNRPGFLGRYISKR